MHSKQDSFSKVSKNEILFFFLTFALPRHDITQTSLLCGLAMLGCSGSRFPLVRLLPTPSRKPNVSATYSSRPGLVMPRSLDFMTSCSASKSGLAAGLMQGTFARQISAGRSARRGSRQSLLKRVEENLRLEIQVESNEVP